MSTNPPFPYCLETIALLNSENNWMMRIAGAKILERRRTKYLRQDIGTKACIVSKPFKVWINWAGNMAKMKEEISETKKEGKVKEN